MARRRSRKSYQGWLNKHVGDLRHMLRCCQTGRLPADNIEYLGHILLDTSSLPKPKEIAAQVRFTYEQQQTHRLYTVPVIDKTEKELAELRRKKDAQRKLLARRKSGVQSRAAYRASVKSKEPWMALGIKKSAYYKRKAKQRAGRSGLGSSEPPSDGGPGLSAHT